MTRGPHGLPECRWCKKEVLPPKRTFCSVTCVYEHRLRSDPTLMKRVIEDRDHGVCAVCGVDCIIQHQELKKQWTAMQTAGVEFIDLSVPLEIRRTNMARFINKFEDEYLKPLGISWSRFEGNRIWDLDHVLEVAAGGGSTGPENIQTLCMLDHKAKTKKFLQERKKSGK